MSESLRDQLTAALNATKEPEPEQAPEPEATVSESLTVEPEVQAETEASQPQEAQELEPLPPPSSWKKDYHDEWAKLPRAVQEYSLLRESQFTKGVSEYKQRADKLAWAEEVEREFGDDLKQAKVEAPTAVRHLLKIHKDLTHPDPMHRKRVLYQIAQDVGVQLDGNVPPPPTAAEQAMFATRAELQAWMRQQQEQQEMQRLAHEIETFKADKPYFDDVRDEMSRLLQAGVAESLQDAYDRAIWGNPAIRLKVMSEQTAQHRQAPTARQKAAAVAPKSSASTASAESAATGKDLRSTIAENLRRAMET